MRSEIDRQFQKKSRPRIDSEMSAVTDYMVSNEVNPEIKKILNVDMLLLVLRRRYLHMHLVSDFETAWCWRYFTEFIEKHPDCHEALFGLAQIYFALSQFEKAVDVINKALMYSNNDIQYLLTKSTILFFYFWHTSNEKVEKKKKIYTDA